MTSTGMKPLRHLMLGLALIALIALFALADIARSQGLNALGAPL